MLGALAALVLSCSACAPAGRCRRWTARCASSRHALRRAGRPLETGTTLRQLEQRLGASDEANAYLRALSASRYGPTPRLPTAAERRALRRALAQGLGWAGRLRAFWALPPRR